MIPEDNINEQNRKLEQMDYDPEEDLFNQEEHIPLDGDGNPILNEDSDEDKIDKGLDIPGIEDDDEMEELGAEDEENNYWSLSDNDDDHEEENTDVID
ncbi:hypothetical protein [Chryseobacterium daecheongense]|uniref:Uncharacterized protein n=1 Tax=Chryseobacterium daecheongense TaxID=192389 RepID=A0A3N0W784_9FLAO|nr:hypothetical protein [Chryseobacterium daecheongense]ROI00892.1 hypothetical protein EGI05_04310 [Chryseobacterium daecheongense]TDX94936.1 hypothetical protein BCF50_0708 [Chryseobacterium daecheongense]